MTIVTTFPFAVCVSYYIYVCLGLNITNIWYVTVLWPSHSNKKCLPFKISLKFHNIIVLTPFHHTLKNLICNSISEFYSLTVFPKFTTLCSLFVNQGEVLSFLSLLLYAKNIRYPERVFESDAYCRMVLSHKRHVLLQLKGICFNYAATEL